MRQNKSWCCGSSPECLNPRAGVLLQGEVGQLVGIRSDSSDMMSEETGGHDFMSYTAAEHMPSQYSRCSLGG